MPARFPTDFCALAAIRICAIGRVGFPRLASRLGFESYVDSSVLTSILESRRDEVVEIAREFHAISIAMFGSVARGDDTSESHIDFLAEFEDGIDMFWALVLRSPTLHQTTTKESTDDP